ncbi:MAG: hypothetical protein MRZ49_10295 [Lachnospiraceae bacterium]|nr:hypothetical protein [Lachnospiraceae bacterium]
MKKEWNTPVVEALELSQTANGAAPNDNFDDTWVSIDGKWYRPGDGGTEEES